MKQDQNKPREAHFLCVQYNANCRLKACPVSITEEFYRTDMNNTDNKPREGCKCHCHIPFRATLDNPNCKCIKECEHCTDMNKTKEIEVCKHCRGDLSVRNPKGICDHLQYPDYCDDCTDIRELENFKSHIKQELIAEIRKRMPEREAWHDTELESCECEGWNSALSEVNEILDSV